MEEWKTWLAGVDDDYLIGLSNKGIVKRAYKDKEESPARIESIGREAVVKVGGETVNVHYPLGESKCSCPSRSICRHVVQAILALRESCLKETAEASSGEGPESADGAGAEQAGASGPGAQVPDSPQTAATVPGQQAPGAMVPDAAEPVRREVAEYPQAALKKALTGRHLQNFMGLAMAEVKPKIKYSSVITVELPVQEFQEKYVVRLLAPLEYSSCSCHKKELCPHKAAAILWCRLEAGILKKEDLNIICGGGELGAAQVYDMDRVKDAAGQIKLFLEELLGTGLSRTSPDVLDYLERLAIISHNAGLARFEGYCRALSDSYDRYFKRKASFQTEEIMGQVARLYRRAGFLLEAENSGEVLRQGGEFRTDYLPVGDLDLIGIAMEHFQSQTGYEGETIYFLEENTKKWYTYTNARPVFYEPGRGRGHLQKSQAPWGLNVFFEDLMKVRIHLAGARCDERGRLSSSQETKGEVAGSQGLEMSDIEGWYYEDFGALFRDRIEKPKKWLLDQDAPKAGVELVYVQPDSCARAEFSQTEQLLTLPLYDKGGRELLVEVTYSKREAGTIRYLEKISGKKLPCFLGKIYLRDGRIRMYPVDVWERKGIL